MSLRVNTNIAGLAAHRHVQRVNSESVKNLTKLSASIMTHANIFLVNRHLLKEISIY